MALISAANKRAFTDKVAAAWDKLKASAGVRAGLPVVGTVRHVVAGILDMIVVSLDDYEQQQDLGTPVNSALLSTNVEGLATVALTPVVRALDIHISNRGSSVASSIRDIASYLSYLNTAPTGAPFASMVHPSFLEAFNNYNRNVLLPPAGVFSPAINPANGSANGMGARAVGGAFTAGDDVDITKYAEVHPIAVVTDDFADGTANPTLTITGTDNTGAELDWTADLGAFNPTSAIATTTAEAIVAQARQTIDLASTSGIVAGSWLTIDGGTPDEEVVLVESVAAPAITAVFRRAHLTGSAVTGLRTFTLTPATAGRRIRSVSDLTIATTGHTAGSIRVEGAQERGAA